MLKKISALIVATAAKELHTYDASLEGQNVDKPQLLEKLPPIKTHGQDFRRLDLLPLSNDKDDETVKLAFKFKTQKQPLKVTIFTIDCSG